MFDKKHGIIKFRSEGDETGSTRPMPLSIIHASPRGMSSCPRLSKSLITILKKTPWREVYPVTHLRFTSSIPCSGANRNLQAKGVWGAWRLQSAGMSPLFISVI